MSRFRLLLLISLLLLAVSGCVKKTDPPRPDRLTYPPLEFKAPQVEQLDLGHGTLLYLQEDRELPLVEVTAMVGAGDIGTPADKTGLGSLFAATLETGGAGEKTPAQIEELLEKMAARLSVSTDTYTTTLHLSLRAEDLETGLELLGDFLRRPRFDEGRFELARKQLLESIRRQDDHPSSVASRALKKAIYGSHPLGRTPDEETVGRIGRGDLVDFHRQHFQPGNLKLAISGDFDRRQLLLNLKGFLEDWPSGPYRPQAVPEIDGPPAGKVIVAAKAIPQTTILMGHIGIERSDPDLFPVRVMNYILGGGGFNSRLMREVRSNRGLAYSVYSYYRVGRRLPGSFVAGSETKSASTLEVLRLMREIMNGMRKAVVSEQELQLAKESLINSFVFAFTDTHSVVTQKMILDHYGYPADYLESYRGNIASVTADDVLAAAERHLHPEELAIVLVGAADEFEIELERLGLPVERVEMGR